jgi:5-oxoprolinase (ATP-hydrolysing) subunit C
VLTLERAGALTTIQDAGRRGLRHIGVAVGGAMDDLAYQLANRLAGNRHGEAAIEIALCPVRIRFESHSLVAIAGAPADAALDGVPLPSGWRAPVEPGQVLHVRSVRAGVRVYLAIAGGLDVPIVLGSRSTDLRAGFGGLQGRRLRDGDRVGLGQSGLRPRDRTRVGVEAPPWEPTLRVVPGPELAEFTPQTRADLWRCEWTPAPESDRMGLRLNGATLERAGAGAGTMPSYGVVAGLIQCPASGQPIVLACDAQTTGGYPRLGVVIRADLWKLAQWRPGTAMRLVPVTRDDAVRAWHDRRRFLDRIESGLDARGP